MTSRFAGAAATAARSAHAHYFSETLLYMPRHGHSIPFDGVLGSVKVETREARGETHRVATRQLRVTSGLSEARHDAAVRIENEPWAIDTIGNHSLGGLLLTLSRTLVAEVARPNYRS